MNIFQSKSVANTLHLSTVNSVQAVDCEIYHSIKVVLKVTKYATSHLKLRFPLTLSRICYFLKIQKPTEHGPNLLSSIIIQFLMYHFLS